MGQGEGHVSVACMVGIDPKGFDILAGGMQIQDVVSCRDDWPHFSGTSQFHAVFFAIEPGIGPDAIEIVRDQTTVKGTRWVKGFISCHIGKAHRQGASQGTHMVVEQMTSGHHATKFIAVGQSIDQNMRARHIGFELMDVVDAHITLPVCR